MDCLFSDNEEKEMLIYAEELRQKNIHPLMYVAPDWDFVNSAYTTTTVTHLGNGCVGAYYGMPVYAFDGLDSHTCCILPDFSNDIKPF